MIFYPGFVDDIVDQTYKNLKTILVYKGSQPDIDTFISRVNSGTYKATGSSLLQRYSVSEYDIETNNQIVQLLAENISGTFYNSGLAEWAVLIHNSQPSTLINTSNSELFVRDITDSDLFMIVPVSDTTGRGVVKFTSIEFTGQKSLTSFTLNVSALG